MDTWYWFLSWFLTLLSITGNGFTIFLVCSRRNLRTKTNAFIVSLVMADFCVGLSDITSTYEWSIKHLRSWVNCTRCLFSNLSMSFRLWVLTVRFNALKVILCMFYFKTMGVPLGPKGLSCLNWDSQQRNLTRSLTPLTANSWLLSLKISLSLRTRDPFSAKASPLFQRNPAATNIQVKRTARVFTVIFT